MKTANDLVTAKYPSRIIHQCGSSSDTMRLSRCLVFILKLWTMMVAPVGAARALVDCMRRFWWSFEHQLPSPILFRQAREHDALVFVVHNIDTIMVQLRRPMVQHASQEDEHNASQPTLSLLHHHLLHHIHHNHHLLQHQMKHHHQDSTKKRV